MAVSRKTTLPVSRGGKAARASDLTGRRILVLYYYHYCDGHGLNEETAIFLLEYLLLIAAWQRGLFWCVKRQQGLFSFLGGAWDDRNSRLGCFCREADLTKR